MKRESDSKYHSFQKLQFEFLQQAYQQVEQIGRGSFAKVIKARQRFGNRSFRAIKRIQINPLNDINEISELSKLKLLKTDHVIQYYGYIIVLSTSQLNIIMNLCQGSLRDQMNIPNKVFNCQQVLNIATQVTSGMLALSSKNIMHLDLKPENILFQKGNYYKLCDFGCSQMFKNFSILSNNCRNIGALSAATFTIQDTSFGTPEYIAPEIQLGINEVGKNSCDIWAFGIILYKLVYRKHPFKQQSNGKVKTSQFKSFLNNQISIDFPPVDQGYPVDLIKQMLILDPRKRLRWQKMKQYLKYFHNREQAEFMDIDQVANSHIKLLMILGKIAKIIQQALQYDYYEQYLQNQERSKFWYQNSQLLEDLRLNLLLLIQRQVKKFYQKFGYKIEQKMNSDAKIEMSFIMANIQQQIRTIYQSLDHNIKIPNNLLQTQRNVRQLLRKLQKQLKSYKDSEQQLQIFRCFINEMLQINSFFCVGHLFQNTCRKLKIY